MISITTEYKAELDYYSMLIEPYGLKITKQGLSPASSQDLVCTFPYYFLRKETIFVADSMTVSPQWAWLSDGMGLYHISLLCWGGGVGIFMDCAAHPSAPHTVFCAGQTQNSRKIFCLKVFSFARKIWVAFGPLEGGTHADASSLRL